MAGEHLNPKKKPRVWNNPTTYAELTNQCCSFLSLRGFISTSENTRIRYRIIQWIEKSTYLSEEEKVNLLHEIRCGFSCR